MTDRALSEQLAAGTRVVAGPNFRRHDFDRAGRGVGVGTVVLAADPSVIEQWAWVDWPSCEAIVEEPIDGLEVWEGERCQST